MTYSIFVPNGTPASTASILPKSAIVSDGTVQDGYVTVHVEGNAYGAENLRSLNTRVKVAAGRLRDSYPTTAIRRVPAHDLIEVATFDETRLVFGEVGNPEHLEAWAGESVKEIVGEVLEPGRHGKFDPQYLQQLNHLGADSEGWLFQSRSGQIVSTGKGDGLEVFSHEDEAIVERLRAMLDDHRFQQVTGQTSDTSPRP